MEQLINWDFVAQNMSCQQYGRRVIPGTIPVGRTLTISSGERIPRPPLSIESKGVRRTSRYAITRRPTVSPRRARESDAGSRGCDGRDIFGLSQDAEFPLQCDWQAAADNQHVVRRMGELFKLTETDDAETGDILIRRMQYHAKQAWMLRSYLHRVDDTAKAA
jgi:hypothetical protein